MYDKHMAVMSDLHPLTSAPMTAQMFGYAGMEHMKKYGKRVPRSVFWQSLSLTDKYFK